MVSRAFSCYDKEVSYVQGMNFIIGQLLMHCNSTISFWLFVELMYELRDNFMDGLPGLMKHSYIMRLLIMKHIPDVHRAFNMHDVKPVAYAGGFIFSIFMNVLPEDKTKISDAYFTLFFKYKWEFFYKLVLTVINHIKDRILMHDNQFDMLLEVKIAMSNKNDALNYANMFEQERIFEIQDSDLESLVGST
jgi:hypothetical protein